MAYDIVFDVPQVSAVVGLDVAQSNPGLNVPKASVKETGEAKAADGREVLQHAALVVALGLGVLWLAGSTVLKDARL